MASLEQQVATLRRELESLKLQLRGSPGVSTSGGAISIRTMQLGFPAELTSAYNSTTGYSWKRKRLEPPDFVNPGVQLTGDKAFEATSSTSVASGTSVWMEPSPDGVGYVFMVAGGTSSTYDTTGAVTGGGAWAYPSTGPVSLSSAITLSGASTGRYRIQMSGFGSLSGTAAAAPFTIPASIDIRKTGSSTQTTGSVVFCAFQATANPVKGGATVSGFVDVVDGDVITGRVTIDATLDPTSSGTWGFTGVLEAFKI